MNIKTPINHPPKQKKTEYLISPLDQAATEPTPKDLPVTPSSNNETVTASHSNQGVNVALLIQSNENAQPEDSTESFITNNEQCRHRVSESEIQALIAEENRIQQMWDHFSTDTVPTLVQHLPQLSQLSAHFDDCEKWFKESNLAVANLAERAFSDLEKVRSMKQELKQLYSGGNSVIIDRANWQSKTEEAFKSLAKTRAEAQELLAGHYRDFKERYESLSEIPELWESESQEFFIQIKYWDAVLDNFQKKKEEYKQPLMACEAELMAREKGLNDRKDLLQKEQAMLTASYSSTPKIAQLIAEAEEVLRPKELLVDVDKCAPRDDIPSVSPVVLESCTQLTVEPLPNHTQEESDLEEEKMQEWEWGDQSNFCYFL